MSDDIQGAIASVTKSVTKAWKQAKRSANRADRLSSSRLARLRYVPSSRVTIREAAFAAMEDAYNKASANGKYYANARQIMYAARPAILSQCDADEFNDVYFTQTLLKDYIEEYSPDWKVVWDARGHLVEPHTSKSVSLGGAGVASYMDQWHESIEIELPSIESQIKTEGPRNRYGNVLFIEKEGFGEILTAAGIGKRYDMAIMSTKGLPVKAACDLILALHGKGVRTLVLRDFDLAGFKIARTLRNGTRLSEGSPVIDLGLRFADIQGLSAEPCSYQQYINPGVYLQCDYDATDEEAAFLVSGGGHNRWSGQRVEINAMTSDQLIAWLEDKFAQYGVKKLIPDTAALTNAYKRAVFLMRMEERIEWMNEQEMEDDDIDIPKNLHIRIQKMLKSNSAKSWDEAIWEIAEGEQP
jgi:hypothetical protein